MALKRTIKRAVETQVITLGEALEEFLVEKEAHNKAAKTIANYQQSLSYFIDFHGLTNDTPLDEITVSDFYKWTNSLKIDGTKPTTINHYLRDCRVFFYWCMDPDRKYMEPFKIKQVEGQEEQIKLFPDEELELLLAKPERSNNKFTDWRTWVVVNWVLATGNRCSTIVDVRIGDIDFRRGEISLHHTKNKKAQIIPLSSSLETTLKEYIKMWRDGGKDKDAWLFPNVGEEQLTTGALQNSFAKYCKARGCTHTNLHGLRHNFAKLWIKNNGDMYKLQKILGHSSLDMTRRYVNMFSEDIKEDYDKFSPLDSIKRKQKRTQVVKRS